MIRSKFCRILVLELIYAGCSESWSYARCFLFLWFGLESSLRVLVDGRELRGGVEDLPVVHGVGGPAVLLRLLENYVGSYENLRKIEQKMLIPFLFTVNFFAHLNSGGVVTRIFLLHF